jgi:hypothetical protein
MRISLIAVLVLVGCGRSADNVQETTDQVVDADYDRAPSDTVQGGDQEKKEDAPCAGRAMEAFCGIDGASGFFAISDSCGNYVDAHTMSPPEVGLFCGMMPFGGDIRNVGPVPPMPDPSPFPPFMGVPDDY